MTGNDRRRMERFNMEIPVSIRTVELPKTNAHMALSSNISASGLNLSTDLQLNVGAPVEISMTMPTQVTGRPSREWLCRARVVRVESRDSGNAKSRVGVEFQYYEVVESPGADFQN